MKQEWITTASFSELHDKSDATINSMIRYCKVNNYPLPSWYKKEGRKVFIDNAHFIRMARLKERCHMAATNPNDGLYWYLMLYLNELQLAKKLALYSRKYKSYWSWTAFLNSKLWRTGKEEIKISIKTEREMIEEFIVFGSFILHSLANRLGIREYE